VKRIFGFDLDGSSFSAMLRLFAVCATAASAGALSITAPLGGVQVTPLVKGRIVADAPPVSLESLWSKRGAVIFAVRRPG
jgi:hypothetical protein